MSAAFQGKKVIVNGAWGIGSLLAQKARFAGAQVCVLLDSVESGFLGKAEKDINVLKSELQRHDSESGRIKVIQCDSADLKKFQRACGEAASELGRIDVVIHNSSLTDKRGLLHLPSESFIAMNETALRRTFWATRYLLDTDALTRGSQILSLSPPLQLSQQTFLQAGVGHSMARLNQSLCAAGLAEELKQDGIAVNCLWSSNVDLPPHDNVNSSNLDTLDEDIEDFIDAIEMVLRKCDSQTASSTTTGQFFVSTREERDNLVPLVYSKSLFEGQNEALLPTGSSVFLPSSMDGSKAQKLAMQGLLETPQKEFSRFRTDSNLEPETSPLHGKTVFITGASRGIGLSIAKKVSEDGANVVLAAKTDKPHPKLPGTIHTAAAACLEKGANKTLALKLDIQDEAGIQTAIDSCVEHFGGIDILINNASAIDNSSLRRIKEKKYNLMHGINARGTYLMTKYAMPHLLKANNPHVLNISPPLSFDPVWLRICGVAYTIAKYNMTLSACGLAEEFRNGGEMALAHECRGVALNCLWPRTAIATAAMDMLAGKLARHTSRTVDIMSDAAYWILTRRSDDCTRNCFIDDDIAKHLGKDLAQYRYSQWSAAMLPLMPDFYVGDPKFLEQLFNFAQKLKFR